MRETGRLGEHATPERHGSPLPPPAPTAQGRTDGLPGKRPCVLGAYLGRGSGEEPAGRWRGEACCLRARRGWRCSGHFHCLQTGKQSRQTEGGKGKAEESISSMKVSPSPLPGGAARTRCPGRGTLTDTSRWAPRLVNPTSRGPVRWPRGEGTGTPRAEPVLVPSSCKVWPGRRQSSLSLGRVQPTVALPWLPLEPRKSQIHQK